MNGQDNIARRHDLPWSLWHSMPMTPLYRKDRRGAAPLTGLPLQRSHYERDLGVAQARRWQGRRAGRCMGLGTGRRELLCIEQRGGGTRRRLSARYSQRTSERCSSHVRSPVRNKTTNKRPNMRPYKTPNMTPSKSLSMLSAWSEPSRERCRAELKAVLTLTHRPHFLTSYLRPALEAGLIEVTLPEKPPSRHQRYQRTAAGERLWHQHATGKGSSA